MSVQLGDWRDLLPGTYDPGRAVVITDPPFGLGAPGMPRRGAWRGRDTSTEKGYPDVVPWAEHVREVLELLPAVRHVIRGPAAALIRRDHPQPRRLCIEVAGYRIRSRNRPGTLPHLWHGWAVYGRLLIGRRVEAPTGDARAIRVRADVIPGRGNHRGVTPYEAAWWMVETWADPGMIVVDPFAGVGTIGRVAHTMGLEYRGAEIVPEWHEQATARTMTRQAVLFG